MRDGLEQGHEQAHWRVILRDVRRGDAWGALQGLNALQKSHPGFRSEDVSTLKARVRQARTERRRMGVEDYLDLEQPKKKPEVIGEIVIRIRR